MTTWITVSLPPLPEPTPVERAAHSFTGPSRDFWAEIQPDPRIRWRWLLWVYRSDARRRREPGCVLVTPRLHGWSLASDTATPAELWESLRLRVALLSDAEGVG